MEKFSYSDFEIFDSHAHIFPAKISEKATINIGNFYGIPMMGIGSSEKLLEDGGKINTAKYLVCSTATVPEQTIPINNFIKEECAAHDKFFGFGTLHPDMENIADEVDRIISLGLHGIKIHPDFQKFNIDDKNAYKIYEAIEGRLPILIHMGDNRYTYSKPYRLARVMKDFPKLKAIAAHFGGYQCWEEALDCLKGENLRLDTSSSLAFFDVEYARKLVQHYGVENLFFGVDFPMWKHNEELERFFALGLSYEENRMILSENFKKFLCD